jgi:hypothetical protein
MDEGWNDRRGSEEHVKVNPNALSSNNHTLRVPALSIRQLKTWNVERMVISILPIEFKYIQNSQIKYKFTDAFPVYNCVTQRDVSSQQLFNFAPYYDIREVEEIKKGWN